MAKHLIDVAETIVIRKRYEVEARTVAEARAKAAIGDTVSEEKIDVGEVIDRELI